MSVAGGGAVTCVGIVWTPRGHPDGPWIYATGPSLVGVTTLAARLGHPSLGAMPLSDDAPDHHRVVWKGRSLRLDVGYRGCFWFPPLGDPGWRDRRSPEDR